MSGREGERRRESEGEGERMRERQTEGEEVPGEGCAGRGPQLQHPVKSRRTENLVKLSSILNNTVSPKPLSGQRTG